MSAKVTAKAVSQVSEQLPSFIGEDYPLYEKFVKNYFEFLETIVVPYEIVTGYEDAYTFIVGETVTGQTSGATAVVKGTGANSGLNKLFLEPTNTLDFVVEETIIGSTSSAYGSVTSLTRNPVNALKLFTSLIDPSQTTEGVLEFFKKEFYPNIRNSSTTDLRKFIQHLKNFYRSKGSENSFRTLFRILYGQENVDFYFPKTDLLKVSDGKWSQDIIVQLIFDSNYLSFNGLTITGGSSGSTAFVSNITDRKLGTIPIIELVLTNASGTFTLGETITATTAAGTVISATITGQLTDITINDGGAGYNNDDEITITDSTLQGFGAAATVANTSGDEVTIMTSTNDGNGYEVDDTFTFDNTGTNADVTAEAKVTELKDTYDLSVITSQLLSAVETISFNLAGASTILPFNVAVQAGFLIADNATFASATKVGEVVSITNSEITVYDRANEAPGAQYTNSGQTAALPKTYVAFADADTLFLFDENETPITGAQSVSIDDASFTTVTSDILLNGSFGADFNNAAIGSSIQDAMTFETKTFGRINAVSITSHGSGYESVPTISITNDYYEDLFEPDATYGGLKGKNAAFTIGTLGGEIIEITISEGGFGYITDPTVTASTNASSTGSTSANLSPVLTATRTKTGVFTDDSGKPSSQKKIQDNDYYQDFSYVIQTSDSIDVWRQDVLKLLHPAGMKLFGEVAIATLLNATIFDRGSNNINSTLENGLSQYRELSLQLITEILDNLYVTAEVEMNKEVQMDLFADNSIYYENSGDDPFLYYEDGAIIIMEDGDDLLTESATEITNSQFTSIASAIIEYLQTILSTNGLPAEFFSLLSIKDVTTVVNDPNLHLELGSNEDGGVILKEDGTNLLAEEPRTKIITSEPHYFHVNDEIYLNEFEGTNVDQLNGKLFSVSDVDIENSTLLMEDEDNIMLESEDGSILSEEISIFTLSDPISLTDYGTIDVPTDDVDTSNVTITTNGNVYRSGKTASSGLPIQLLNKEYIGEYSDYEIDHYTYHYFSGDLSSISSDTYLQFDPYDIIVDQNGLLLEDGDEILLEDSFPSTHASYSGTSSGLGKLIEEEIVLSAEHFDGRITLTEAETKVVLGSYLKDETTAGEDNILLEDNEKIEIENSGFQNGVLTFDQPFDYVRQSGTNGFGYFKHRVDQRVSV